MGLSFLIIKWVGKRELDLSIFSSSKISESMILNYKHLLLNPSVGISHLYPVPKRTNMKISNFRTWMGTMDTC